MTPGLHSDSLRFAVAADLPEIVALDHEAFSPYGTAESAEVFARRLQVFPAGFVVAEDQGVIVGYGCSEKWLVLEEPALDQDPERRHRPHGTVFCITGMAVSLSHRGRGLGLAIAQRLLAIAQDQGCQHIVLETTHAQGLYERIGFRHAGERAQDGVTLTVMQLDLVRDSDIDVLRNSG
jgi:ribosomal protein S18 acetylase RimI-like enzyme